MMAATLMINAACANESDESDPGSGSSAVVGSCSELCSLAPAPEGQANCVASFIASRGYGTAIEACNNSATNTPGGCLDCYGSINVSDSDCAAAHGECF